MILDGIPFDNDIALYFNLSKLRNTQNSKLSGFVRKGGITAVIGSSGSGKSDLLKSLLSDPSIKINQKYASCKIGSSPTNYTKTAEIGYADFSEPIYGQDFSLMELLIFKSSISKFLPFIKQNYTDQEQIIDIFQLADISSKPLKYLSEDQKKRCRLCYEMYYTQSIMLLDEPVRGLDASISFDLLKVIKDTTTSKSNENSLSIMLTIEQPTYRMLELFDNILIMGRQGMLYFGTVTDSIGYLNSIGFSPPDIYNSIDYFLQITDLNYPTNATANFDFVSSFSQSKYFSQLSIGIRALELHNNSTHRNMTNNHATISNECLKWIMQFILLSKRSLAAGCRDITGFYIQFAFVIVLCVAIGFTSFNLQYNIDDQVYNVIATVHWILATTNFVPICRIFHMHRDYCRFKQERTNKMYCFTVHWFSYLMTEAFFMACYLPPTILTQLMVGLPMKSLLEQMLLYFLVTIGADAMFTVIVILSIKSDTAIVAAQLLMFCIVLFDGCFIQYNRIPSYWIWLKESNMITQSVRAGIMTVMNHLSYQCQLDTSGVCRGVLDEIYPCSTSSSSNSNSNTTATSCMVRGRDVLFVKHGIATDQSPQYDIYYLVAIYASFQLIALLLLNPWIDGKIRCLRDKISSCFRDLPMTLLYSNWISNCTRMINTNNFQKVHLLQSFKESSGTQIALYDQPKEIIQSNSVMPFNQPSIYRSPSHESHYTRRQMSTVDNRNSISHIQVTTNRLASSLTWRRLNVTLKNNGQKALDNVSGIARSGSTLAIMGPSGSGSTTLLNALCGRATYASVTGDIRYCGRALTSSDLVFVPKSNEMNGNLTVYEQIYLIGSLKCRDLEAMNERLKNLTDILKLSSKLTMNCKRLFNGDKKLVGICMGMVSNPNILFLDEPTSDMDTAVAQSIMSLLNTLAKDTKVAVIMTIKKSSSLLFGMIQNLYLIERGRLAYFGPVGDAKRFFSTLGYQCPESVSAADYYLDLVYSPPTEDPSITWKNLYLTFNIGALMTAKDGVEVLHGEGLDTFPPSQYDQFILLLMYFIKYYSREKGLFGCRLFFSLVFSLFTSSIYINLPMAAQDAPNLAGAVENQILLCCFIPVATTYILLLDYRDAIEKAKNGVISAGTYNIAQFIASIPFHFVVSLLFVVVFLGISSLADNNMLYLYATLIHTCHQMLAETILMILVLVFKNAVLSLNGAFVVIGCMILLSGFFIKVVDMPVWFRWLCYLNPTKYSYDGLLWMFFDHRHFISTYRSTGYITGNELLKGMYKQRQVNPWAMLVILFLWVLIFRLLWYVLFAIEVYPYRCSSHHSGGTLNQSKVNITNIDHPSSELTNTNNVTATLAPTTLKINTVVTYHDKDKDKDKDKEKEKQSECSRSSMTQKSLQNGDLVRQYSF